MAESSTDWAALANAAASYYAADRAADAAKEGGQQAVAGTQQSNDLLREFYNRDQARQEPFYQAGLAAQNQYMAMMGLTPYSGASQGTPISPSQYVTEGADGMPVANAALYASNPQYRAAWDQTLQQHRDQWKGNGYHSGSDNAWITDRIGQRMPSMQTGGNQQPQQAPMSQSAAFAQFRSTPGYQFGLNEGAGQIQASAAARGGLNSGATLKALQRYGNDYADQQGYTPYMNKLAGLFGGAQTAAGQMGQAGQQYGGKMGQNAITAGIARGQSTYDAAESMQQGYGQMARYGGQAYDAWRGG